MATKKIINLICILLGMVGTKAFAYDFQKDGLYYNLDSYDMTAIVTYGESLYEGDIIIPNEVSYNGRTMSVKAVGREAFLDCVNLSSIQFGDFIKEIGYNAFYGCTKIRKLTIPSNVETIDSYAFYHCTSLEELIIEDGKTTLGCGLNGKESPSAVFDCKLKYLYIGRDMGNPAYGNVYNLDNTNLSTLIIGSGKTIISGFKGAKIKEITIPSNVTFIDGHAFWDCYNLESVYFEDSDEPLVWGPSRGTVFKNCPIKSVYMGRNMTPREEYAAIGNEGLLDDSPVEEIIVSKYVTILCGFNNCINLKEIVIPSSVIEVCGFKGCSSLLTIKCEPTTPPSLRKSYYTLAENSTYVNGILYVPTGSVNNYKNDENWGKFFNIQEGSPSGIHNIEVDGTNELQRYTLDGRLIKNSHKGINIIKMENGTTKKVLVK